VKHLERQYIRPLERLKFGQPILDEGHMIQSCLAREFSGRNTPADKLSRRFSKLMMEGKVRAALRLIANDNTGQPLHLDSIIDSKNPSESVFDILIKKYPPKNLSRKRIL